MGKFANTVLAGGAISKRELEEAEVSTYVSISSPIKSYTSYFWMVITSAIIATGGIASNSTAVVVGAMIVAPLMSPIVGTTLAAVVGNGRAAVRTLLMTAAGAALGVLVAFVIAAIIPVAVDLDTNSQVLSRTSPRIVDMLVALGAGAIAALAIIREDIPAVIPGVAIAVSLMPPLCVVGVALQGGGFGAALGAFLLFMTNYFAIQITGVVIFALLGLGKSKRDSLSSARRALWYGAIVLGFVVVSIPLVLTSADMVKTGHDERAVSEAAQAWLSQGDYDLKSVETKSEKIEVTIAGSGKAPSIDAFKDDLKALDVDTEDVSVITLNEARL